MPRKGEEIRWTVLKMLIPVLVVVRPTWYVHQENAHHRPRGNVPHSLVGAGYTEQLALAELCRLVRC